MKVLIITITTNEKTGALFNIKELDLKETAKSYVGSGTRVDKSKLLVVDSSYYNFHHPLRYRVYALPEDKDKAVKMLIESVNQKFNQLNKLHQDLTTSINILNGNA